MFYTVSERTYEVHYVRSHRPVYRGGEPILITHEYSDVQLELPEGTWRVELHGLPERVTLCVGPPPLECFEAQFQASFDATIFYGKLNIYGVGIYSPDG